MNEQWKFGRNWYSWVPLYNGLGLQGDQRRPYDFARVWIMREEWPRPVEIYPRDLPPEFNVAGLLWTPDPPLSAEHLPEPASAGLFKNSLSAAQHGTPAHAQYPSCQKRGPVWGW